VDAPWTTPITQSGEALMKQAIALGAVQETMLITLYARALAARSGGALLDDPRAVDIVQALDYDFRRFTDEARGLGAVLRTRVLDEMVRAFLVHVPRATVVEIGAGLNARFERLDNGTLRWVDVDLPDAMRLRRRFFTETACRTMVAASVIDPVWTDVVRSLEGPYLLIAEGVFGYLQEAEVKAAFALIAQTLPGSIVVFDSASSRRPEKRRGHRVWPGLRARSGWVCEDPRQIEGWGLGCCLLDSRSLSEMAATLAHVLPFPIHYSLALARILGWEVDTSRLNAFRVGPPPRAGASVEE
jgi:O-methyltransferase involved in polyketide biosynthesis